MDKIEFEKIIEKHLPFFENRTAKNWDAEILMRDFACDIMSNQVQAVVKVNFADIIDEHIEIAKNDCMNENTSYMRGYIKGCNKIKEIIASKISA